MYIYIIIMTSVQLQYYLSKSKIFSTVNVFAVELIDGVIHNRVPTQYQFKISYYDVIEISLYRKKYRGDLFLKLSMDNTEIVSYKLNDLTLNKLIKELDKIIKNDKKNEYNQWRKDCLIEYRNNLIENILMEK